MAEPRLQPVPRQLRARPAGPGTTAATRSARCTTSTPRSPAATARGRASSQYVQEAQVQNYETQRAQFEAYIDHSTNSDAPSTGIVYWQLNKGWPTLLWDLYNHDFDQAGSYFGAKKANEPVHVLYAYDDGTVDVDNLSGRDRKRAVGARPRSTTWPAGCSTTRPRRRDHRRRPGRRAPACCTPRCPPPPRRRQPAKTYFVELLLERTRRGRRPQRLLALDPAGRRRLGEDDRQPAGDDDAVRRPAPAAVACRAATVRVTATTQPQPVGTRRRRHRTEVTITNTSTSPTVAFFLRADVRRGSASGAPAAGRQRGAADLLERQRHHAVAGRVRDAAGHLPDHGPARRLAGGQRVGSELAASGRAGVLISASS